MRNSWLTNTIKMSPAEAEGGAGGEPGADGPVFERVAKAPKLSSKSASLEDIAADIKKSPKWEQIAKAQLAKGQREQPDDVDQPDDDPDGDGGEPAPIDDPEAIDDAIAAESEEDVEDEVIDEKLVEKHPKFLAVAKERDEARQFHRETYDYLLKSVERETGLEDALEDAQDELEVLRAAIDAANLEFNPAWLKQRELQKKLREFERKEKRATESTTAQKAAEKAARQRQFQASLGAIATAHGIDANRLLVELRREHDVAKLDGRKPRSADQVAASLKGARGRPVATNVSPIAPRVQKPGRGGRAASFPHTAEGDYAFAAAVAARRGVSTQKRAQR